MPVGGGGCHERSTITHHALPGTATQARRSMFDSIPIKYDKHHVRARKFRSFSDLLRTYRPRAIACRPTRSQSSGTELLLTTLERSFHATIGKRFAFLDKNAGCSRSDFFSAELQAWRERMPQFQSFSLGRGSTMNQCSSRAKLSSIATKL